MKFLAVLLCASWVSSSAFASADYQVEYTDAEAQGLYMTLVSLQVTKPSVVNSNQGAGNEPAPWTSESLWTIGPVEQLACTRTTYRRANQKVEYACTVSPK